MEGKKSDCNPCAELPKPEPRPNWYGTAVDYSALEMALANHMLESSRRAGPELGQTLKKLAGNVWIKESSYHLVKEIIERPKAKDETMTITWTEDSPPVGNLVGVLQVFNHPAKGTFTVTIHRDGPCPDCLNTPGKYVGFTTVEECRKCKGSAKGGKQIVMESGPHPNELVLNYDMVRVKGKNPVTEFVNEYQATPPSQAEDRIHRVSGNGVAQPTGLLQNFNRFGRFDARHRTMNREQIEAQTKAAVMSKEEMFRFMYGVNYAQQPDGKIAVDVEGPVGPSLGNPCSEIMGPTWKPE